MSVIVFAESQEGKLKKQSKEAIYYASKVGEMIGKPVVAVALGSVDPSELTAAGHYGASKVVHIADNRFDHFDSQAFTKAITEVAQKENAEVVVLSFTMNGKHLGPRLSARLKAGLVTAALTLPDLEGGDFVVKKSAFSGKGFANYSIKTPVKIIALNPNSLQPQPVDAVATVETFAVNLSDADFKIQIKGTQKAGAGIPLPEAEKVVSAGRGLKSPENWGMIEEMAEIIGAATACSRAVSDVHWRPHHEHVGQTGLTVSPNLYIAVAISGAIQHLAGVSSSKTIVVINSDPEAPFFKAADYGIVGDAFEVVPKLNQALRNFLAR